MYQSPNGIWILIRTFWLLITLLELKYFELIIIWQENQKWSKKRQKIAIFCCFGGSAGLAEASAEAVRRKITEASAEASVSVVH